MKKNQKSVKIGWWILIFTCFFFGAGLSELTHFGSLAPNSFKER